jgi:hypothetical protein
MKAMKQRKPYHSSRLKVTLCFQNLDTELLPLEVQKLTRLSRPTIFNVLKYFKNEGIVAQSGKRYRLTPFKTKKAMLKPLEGYWRFAYESLIERYAEKHGITVEDIPGWYKEMLEASIRNQKHFVHAWGRERILKDLPGAKSKKEWNSSDLPINRDANEWYKGQMELLKKLRKP